VEDIEIFNADQKLQRLAFIGSLTMAKPIGEYATWLLTGTATIIGALIINIENVAKMLSIFTLQWGLLFLVISMLIGVFVKQIGIGIASGVSISDAMFFEMSEPSGQKMLRNLTLNQDEFKEAISSAYLWPLTIFSKKAFDKGTADNLAGLKKFIKLLCIQIYLINIQGFFVATGLLFLVFGIRSNS